MSTTTREEWLSSLKAGDQVAIQGGLKDYYLYIVAQRTKQHIILSTGAKYRADSGRAVKAGKWDSNYITEVTPQVLATIKRHKLESDVWGELVKISNINVVRKLSNEQLEDLLAVLRKQEAQG